MRVPTKKNLLGLLQCVYCFYLQVSNLYSPSENQTITPAVTDFVSQINVVNKWYDHSLGHFIHRLLFFFFNLKKACLVMPQCRWQWSNLMGRAAHRSQNTLHRRWRGGTFPNSVCWQLPLNCTCATSLWLLQLYKFIFVFFLPKTPLTVIRAVLIPIQPV